eukprot:scaffold81208_cov31-Phaeocystis_antarctica.AAC.1
MQVDHCSRAPSHISHLTSYLSPLTSYPLPLAGGQEAHVPAGSQDQDDQDAPGTHEELLRGARAHQA